MIRLEDIIKIHNHAGNFDISGGISIFTKKSNEREMFEDITRQILDLDVVINAIAEAAEVDEVGGDHEKLKKDILNIKNIGDIIAISKSVDKKKVIDNEN